MTNVKTSIDVPNPGYGLPVVKTAYTKLNAAIRAHKALKNKCDADVDKERYKAIEEALVRELRLFKDKGYEVIESTVSTLTSM